MSRAYLGGVDLLAFYRRAWLQRPPTTSSRARAHPPLNLRRSRGKEHCSGRAYYQQHRCVVTVPWEAADPVEAMMVVLHEQAHLIAGIGSGHSVVWKRRYLEHAATVLARPIGISATASCRRIDAKVCQAARAWWNETYPAHAAAIDAPPTWRERQA